MRVKFTADYDHRWPSRAVTAFKAGYEGTVKREVGERAISKARATEVRKAAKLTSDAAASKSTDLGRSRRVAEPHDADDVGAVVRPAVMDGRGQ